MILPTILFFKHQNKVLFVNKLINSRTCLTEELSSDFPDLNDLRNPFSFKKIPDLDDFISRGTKMTNTGPFLWIGSLKIQNFK
jgi:hypothetical protein